MSTQVAVYQVIPLCLVGFSKRRWIKRRGIINQEVESAETGQCLFGQAIDLFSVGEGGPNTVRGIGAYRV